MPRTPRPLPAHLGTAFTCADAMADGVTSGRLRGRDLERPFRGARLLPTGALLDDGPLAIDRRKRDRVRLRAAAARGILTPHAALAGLTAAAVWGAPLPDEFDPDDDLCLITPHPHRAPRGRGVRGREVRSHLFSTEERDGLRVTSPASTWALLGGELSPRWLTIIGDHLVRIPRSDRGAAQPHLQLASPQLLERALREPGRRHRAGLEAAFAGIRVGSASRLETEYRLDAAAAGLPELELDVEIRNALGRLLGIADGVYARFGIIVEIEGDHHRTSRAQWNRDIDRFAAFAAQGWEVIRLTGARVRGGTAVAVVARALRRHGWPG